MTGVRIVRVVQKLCAGLQCPLRFCDELITLDKSTMSTHSTARLSFVTPRHVRTASCQCEGTRPSSGAHISAGKWRSERPLLSFQVTSVPF